MQIQCNHCMKKEKTKTNHKTKVTELYAHSQVAYMEKEAKRKK